MLLILRKHLTLAATGGLLYVILELVWRGRSHWSMFVLGGLCFVALGLLNEVLSWGLYDYWPRIFNRLCG